MPKTRRFAVLLLMTILVSAVAALPVLRAQDTMTHTCDSTTILLTYLAENDYGYQPMMDMSTFELGQYAPLFDAMMAIMDEGEMMEATEEAMMEEMAEMEMVEGMTMLHPLTLADEDPACTELRASVEAFLYEKVVSDMMMVEAGS